MWLCLLAFVAELNMLLVICVLVLLVVVWFV